MQSRSPERWPDSPQRRSQSLFPESPWGVAQTMAREVGGVIPLTGAMANKGKKKKGVAKKEKVETPGQSSQRHLSKLKDQLKYAKQVQQRGQDKVAAKEEDSSSQETKPRMCLETKVRLSGDQYALALVTLEEKIQIAWQWADLEEAQERLVQTAALQKDALTTCRKIPKSGMKSGHQ